MPFIDTDSLTVTERLPGWYGRYFQSQSMTFAHYDFKSGSSIHEHFHPQEEVYEVIEGELEMTVDGVSRVPVLMITHVVAFYFAAASSAQGGSSPRRRCRGILESPRVRSEAVEARRAASVWDQIWMELKSDARFASTQS